TMFLAIADVRTGKLRYCDAGHCTPYILDPEGKAKPLRATKHLPVGVFGDTVYEDHETVLSPGEMLVLYTDGITEAESPDGKWFGEDRMLEVLAGCGRLSPGDATDVLIHSVQQFIGDKSQS